MTRSVLTGTALAAVLLAATSQSLAGSIFDAPRGSPADVRQTPDTTRANITRGAQGPAAPGTPTTRVATPSNSPAVPPSNTPPPANKDAMQFQIVREGPAEQCGTRCRTWVMASGTITNDTPTDFQQFAEGKDLRNAVVVLNSIGGSVYGGLTLGEHIRKLNLSTTVGVTNMLPSTDSGEPRASLSPRAHCASMCAFVLIAGVRRQVPPEAQLLVHQIWPSKKREGATSASYTAEEMTSTQKTVGVIARYVAKMGVDVEMFEISMRIAPWERLYRLNIDEMRRMQVVNTENAFEAPIVQAPTAPAPAATRISSGSTR